MSGDASGGVLQSCALVHSTRGVPPHAPITLLCCAQLRWATYLVQRSTAQCSGTRAGDERPQSGRNRLSRPSNRIKSNNNHSRQIQQDEQEEYYKTNMVGGALSPQGGREASFLTAARSAKKISRCKNSTAVDNYPRAFLRAWSKTKIKVGKPAISRRSIFHFWRPSSRPSPHRTAASNSARQEACESEEFAFGLWWPLRGGVGVFWLQWPPEGLPLWLPSWLSLPVYAQSSDSNASARSKPFVLSVQSSTDTVTSVSNTHFNPRLPRVNSQHIATTRSGLSAQSSNGWRLCRISL